MSEGELIERVAARGDGVTASGRFVPMSAPGDRLLADGGLARGPHHADPPCRHFPECGGCQLQHIDDASYAGFLVERITAALAAQDIAAPDILPAHISPPFSRRRASVSAERRGNRLLAGFKAEASHRIVDMHECFILRPELFALVAPLRILLGDLLPHKRSATVRMTLGDQGPDVLVEKLAADDLASTEALACFAQTHRLGRLAVDDGFGAQTLWEPEPLTVTLGGLAVALPHNCFLQATLEGETALVAAVRTALGGVSAVADLFAGIGTFALALDGRIFAAEGSRDAILALKSAADRAQRPIVAEHRDLYRRPLDEKELSRFEAVVLDPPRAGAKEQVAEIARSAVPRVAYVSCNPVTFARDAKLMIEGGYHIDWIKPIGQFRWSTHVELAAKLSRA
ncbi:MAG TPA: class I SAM-dependent RNA methyltransferase [Allosphingosinicella sp.]|nr:class I SAM-dependent RNA methyltransferase [Allosphingosinicella sp.]